MASYQMQGSSTTEKHGAAGTNKDNTEKYNKLEDVTPQDLTQLLKLDKEIARLFEV